MKSAPPTHVAVGEEVTEIRIATALVPMRHYRTLCGRSVPPAFVASGQD